MAPAWAAGRLDETPRMAVVSAFPSELALLLGALEDAQAHEVNGITFTTGRLADEPVVLFLSGVSMVNAAMTTQLALDRFHVTHIVFSGIAGGVDPQLNIGDVVVAARWGQYDEFVFARAQPDGSFVPPAGKQGLDFAHFGMMFPRALRVRTAARPDSHYKFWFDVDPDMLAVAASLPAQTLAACNARHECLEEAPRLVIGGNGISGSIFVDNAAFRRYSHETFDARVLDMESAACAVVAYSNGVPFIAFRALSDLAGGGPGENEMHTFMDIAANNSAGVVLAFLEAWHGR